MTKNISIGAMGVVGLAILLALALIVGFMPQVSGATGNGAPSGAHYNLNIIGMPKGKTADMSNTSGHSLFVKLDGKTSILLCESGVDTACANVDGFAVIDRNGTDGSATFALPDPVESCVTDGNGEFTSCTTKYSVFARAPGNSSGSASMSTCGTITSGPDTGQTVCSVQVFAVTHSSKFQNVTKYLLFVYADVDDDGNVELVPIFDDRLEGYYWDYDNNGLKLLQLRFYPCASTVNLDGTQSDTCGRTGN